MTRIEKLRKIVDDHQYAKIDGVLVDILTARSILKCYEVGNDHTKKVIENARIEKIGELAMKLGRK